MSLACQSNDLCQVNAQEACDEQLSCESQYGQKQTFKSPFCWLYDGGLFLRKKVKCTSCIKDKPLIHAFICCPFGALVVIKKAHT